MNRLSSDFQALFSHKEKAAVQAAFSIGVCSLGDGLDFFFEQQFDFSAFIEIDRNVPTAG